MRSLQASGARRPSGNRWEGTHLPLGPRAKLVQAVYEKVVRSECMSTVTCQRPRAAWAEWVPRPLRQLRSPGSIGRARTERRGARISGDQLRHDASCGFAVGRSAPSYVGFHAFRTNTRAARRVTALQDDYFVISCRYCCLACRERAAAQKKSAMAAAEAAGLRCEDVGSDGDDDDGGDDDEDDDAPPSCASRKPHYTFMGWNARAP